jgi:hypothetical protein
MNTTVTTHSELSSALREALSRDAAAFVDALYGVDQLDDAQLRELVSMACEQTKAMFERARARLAGAELELVDERREGDRYITIVQVAGGPRLEIVVDDVYERDGGLHTRDLVRINQV